MKTLFKTIFLLTIIFGGSIVSAQTPTPTAPLSGEYTVLAPLPGTTKNCTGTNCTADINSYLGGFLNLVIGIGAVLAMIMIGFYGFQYAVSDSASVKMANSAKLWEIVQGLLLIISAYAIIYTINPALLNFSLEITTPKAPVSAVSTTGTVVGGNAINYDPCPRCITSTIGGVTVQVDSSLMTKLEALNELSAITVTESWPPTRNHGDSCHKNGTCVDAVPRNRDVSTSNAVKMITDARKVGAGAVFESSNPESVRQVKAQLRAAGISESYALYLPTCGQTYTPGGCITGTHFSIYNNLKFN